MAAHIPALQRVHLGGGEPFTRSDIGEIAVRVSNEWNAGVVCIPTNGWFTDRIVTQIRHYGEHAKGRLRLHFSINSHDPADMDNFTQLKGSFERWRRSAEAALNLVSSYPQITVVALATYNEFNQHNFKKLIDFVHRDVGVQDFSFQLVRSHGTYAPTLDLEHFREMNDYYFRTYNRQHPVLSSFREATRCESAAYFESPGFRRSCASGKIRLVLSPGGDVYPCEKLGYPNLRTMQRWNIGNIREFRYDINALVRSPKAREIYAKICDARCHCDHNIDQSLALLASHKFRRNVIRKALRKLTASSSPIASS